MLKLIVMTEFYVNPSPFFSELKKYLDEKGCELFLVQAEYKGSKNTFFNSHFYGLDVALSLSSKGRPIILCSFMPGDYFLKNEHLSLKFSALIGKNNIGFMDTINGPGSFYQKYLEVISDKKNDDILAIELEKKKRREHALARLKHSLGSSPGTKRIALAVENARKEGLEGTDEQILQEIINFKPSHRKDYFSGKYFPGVFCDVEGTLLLKEGNVNSYLLQKLKNLSLEKPITLWTAGDVKEYRKKLFSHNILWKLVSKHDFYGAKVEIAYDDLSYEYFLDEYGIEVDKFYQISEGFFDDDLELSLDFLHSLITPAGPSLVLKSPRFSHVLNMTIKQKKIRDYVESMQSKGSEERDALLSFLAKALIK
jgi:hypothetical protein